MSTAALVSLLTAAAGLATAIAGVISSWRGHLVVNKEVKPQAQANTDAVLRLAQDATTGTEAAVRKIINGAAAKETPGE